MDDDSGAAGVTPLLGPGGLDRLRTALSGFTVDAVHELLGPLGRAAHDRGDLAGVARALRGADGERLATLVRLFLLGEAVDERRARAALHPLRTDAAQAAGIVAASGDAVRAAVEIRPYAEADSSADSSGSSTTAPWWVVSDLGADVCPGPLAADHVLGVGSAALTLAGAVARTPVGRALDVGTGCGVQALHLARHAGAVTATDISAKALRYAATTAALSAQHWDLRRGSLLEPVAGESFDLVVANPPFVVSPGPGAGLATHDYRDSGLPGDAVCASLVRGLPALLAAGGTAQLLANWIIPNDGAWAERVSGWVDTTRCDAWIWQREVAGLGEYVAMWLRDAGAQPGTPAWITQYDTWLDWLTAQGAAAVGMGMVTLWRRDSGPPVLVAEDVPQAYEQPIGPHLPPWHTRQRWLADVRDTDLASHTFCTADGLVRSRQELRGTGPDKQGGWATARTALRQSYGLRWEIEVDDAMDRLVAACDGSAPLSLALDLLAATVDADPDDVTTAALPVVRDLVARGLLVPAGLRGADRPAGRTAAPRMLAGPSRRPEAI